MLYIAVLWYVRIFFTDMYNLLPNIIEALHLLQAGMQTWHTLLSVCSEQVTLYLWWVISQEMEEMAEM